jgi:hypothetical protein
MGVVLVCALACCIKASLVGGLQRGLDAPDAHVVEVEPVAALGFQGVDEQVLLGDLFKQLVELLVCLHLVTST